MNLKSFFIGILFTGLFFTNNCEAQLLMGLSPRQWALTNTNGIYGNKPVFALGVARTFYIKIEIKKVKILDDHMTLFVDFADRTGFHHDNNFQFVYGGQGYIIRKNNFKLLFRKTFTLNRYVVPEFSGTYLGGELEIMPGIYKENHFYAALDIYFGDSFKGYVTGDPKLTDILMDVKTGWITPHLATFKLGINGGCHVSKKVLLHGHVDYSVIRPDGFKHAPGLYGFVGISYIIQRPGTKTPAARNTF